MHDLVIRGGLVVDGTGAKGRTADIAIDNGLVMEVGKITAKGAGTCYVYVYAHNGVSKKIKVTVK